MKGILSAFIAGACLVFSSTAAVTQSASVSQSDVQAAVTAASSGDTIVIPPGASTWSTGVTITGKTLHIIGSGDTNNASGTYITTSAIISPFFLNNGAVTDGPSEIANIYFKDGAGTPANRGLITVSAGKQFRVHDCTFEMKNSGTSRGVWIYGFGLVDHCRLVSFSNANQQGVTFMGGGGQPTGGHTEWNVSFLDSVGTTNRAYVEDTLFDMGGDGDGAVDAYNGAKYTVRHDTIKNSNFISNHGFDSGVSGGLNGYEAPHSWEFYDNVGIYESGKVVSRIGQIRGGSGVAYSNIITVAGGLTLGGLDTEYYRASEPAKVSSCCGFGFVTGTNAYDGNSNAFGWPARGQIGTTGPIIGPVPNGTSPNPAYTNTIMALQTAYFWGNTRNGVGFGMVVSTNNDNSAGRPLNEDLIKEGRDFTNAVWSGYDSLTLHYPHPLQSFGTTPVPVVIASQNPSSGVEVDTTGDYYMSSSVTSPATNYYVSGVTISLTAPPAAETKGFAKWQLNGTDYSTSPTITPSVNGSQTFTAIYTNGAVSVWAITVSSVKPDSGVVIASTADNLGISSVSTLGMLAYNNSTSFVLTAPATSSVGRFRGWWKDGSFLSAGRSITNTASADAEYTAVYRSAAVLNGKITISGNVAFQ